MGCKLIVLVTRARELIIDGSLRSIEANMALGQKVWALQSLYLEFRLWTFGILNSWHLIEKYLGCYNWPI